ncbi:MAG: phenylacetate-CoA oxygenase subunit PaaC [Actinomycetota bacterium]|nr:phenylacetate-CoA oxygenase subunit PaaC [Actinomycetota bacterium]
MSSLASPTTLPPLAAYALGLGDDALVLAQRLGEWVTRAPQIEEDVAIGNLALDLLGQARTLLAHAGGVEGAGRDEDDLAYLRDDRDFRNVHLVEIPNRDFAVTMARQLAFSAYQYELYAALLESSDDTLAGLAGKAVKEVAYHRDHASQWVLRLGDGTEESHARMQAGLDRVWPYIEELFDADDVAAGLPGVAVEPPSLRPAWSTYVDGVLAEATMTRPQPRWRSRGGRAGLHSEHLGHLLAEMQHLHRSHPGATW